MDALALVSRNSGSPLMSSSTAFGFSVTVSSRHCGVLLGFGGWLSLVCPVGVMISCAWFSGAGGTDSKAWMGSASKNSWANINGVLSSSACALA